MSAEHDFEWFLQHQEAYDSLTVEQVHALGRGELVAYGETKPAKAAEDSSGSPAAAEDEAKKAADEAAAKAEAEAATAKKEDPVILAKDGKNTIPFSELEESRAKAAQFEALARDQAALIEDLKAAKVADKGTGATDAQDEVMKQFKENYPELAEMLAPAVQKMIDAGVNAKVEALEARFAAALAPIQKTANDNSIDAHFAAIEEAHADFRELVEKGAVAKWIETLPSYARPAAEAVMKEGNADQVIELFTDYKKSIGTLKKPPADTKEQLEAKANAAIAKAKSTKVTSLTDLPASSGTEANEEPTTVEGWSEKFSGMSPAQIRKECGLPA